MRAAAAGRAGGRTQRRSLSRERRPVRHAPSPALHGRLRDARLGRRRRGRRAGGLAEVDATSTSDEVRDPRAYLVRIVTRQGARPAADGVAAARGLRRPVAAGAAADEPRRGRGRRAGGQPVDGDAAGAGDADADPAGGVRAARGLRRRRTTSWPRPSARSEAAVRQIAHRARAHVAERRPRGVVSRADTRSALEAFQRALVTGDLQDLVDVLAPDVVAARRRRRHQAGAAPTRARCRQGGATAPGRARHGDGGRSRRRSST